MEELENTGSLFNTSPKNNQIDPPKKSIFNTQGVKPISRTTHLNSEVHGYNLGIGDSKFDEGLTYATDIDQNNIAETLNEYRAVNEPVLNKVGAGLGRVLTKATTEILKMPGVLVGIAAAPFAEEGEGFETAFNNQWIKSLNNINENINQELLPVYVKKAVSEGNLWDNISSIDFWATEGADGIGFIASMLAPGAALKSLNLGSKILGTTAKGIALANGEAKLAGATQLLTDMGVTAEGIDLTATTMANTFFEAGSEAGSAMDNFDKGKQDYVSKRSLEKFAELDNQRRSGQITIEQYNNLSALVPEQVDKEFNEQKGRLGRDIFLSNVAILLGPNAIQSKMIWGRAGAKQLVNQVEPTLLRKAANRGKNIVAATASEGFFEEAGQSTVENVFTNSANKGQLTNNFAKDFNVRELLDGYAETISSTDGQKAIFLGGFLGGGMSAYHGAKQDKGDRNRTNALISLAEGTVNNFNTVSETDPFMRNEDGSIQQSPRTGQPIYDPVKVNKIAKGLALSEQQNQQFEAAVTRGDEDTVQRYKDQAINQLILPFINQGEMGVDALKQYLEQSKKGVDIESQNDPKAYDELTKSIVDKANYLQTQYQSYRDFSNSLVKLDEIPNATSEDYKDFYNDLSDFYLNYKADEYSQRKKLDILNKNKADLIKELSTNQSLLEANPQFTEGVTEEIYRNNKIESDPRIKSINDKINSAKQELKNIDEIINNFVWNKSDVNRAFKERVRINNKLREDNSPEKIVKADEDIAKIKNATTTQEVYDITTDNEIIKQQAQDRKDELAEQDAIIEDRERQLAISAELQGALIPEDVATNLSNLDFENQSVSNIPNTVESLENIERNNIEKRRKDELEKFTTSINYARKGDKGIYYTNHKGLRQDWETDEEVTVVAVSKLGILFNTNVGNNNDWKNFKDRWHNFINFTRRDEINDKYNKELSKLEPEVKLIENSYNNLNTTEGSEFTDELVPEEGINNTSEEITAISNGNIDNGKGVKVISTNKSTGEPFDFILEQFPGYIEFEREPINKEGRQVGFEINQNPGNVSNEVKKALNAFNSNNFTDQKLIYDYLPINVQFTDQIKAPIETKRKNGNTDKYTELLRIEIVSRLIQGQPINNIKGSIQGQYKGLLKIDNNQEGVAENSISELDAVKSDWNYIRNNLYVVNSQGQLQNIINANTMSFSNPFTKDSNRTKENAKGEIYLIIPQANGQSFPLKLNIKKINDIEANILFDIYSEILNSEKSLNTTLIEVNDQLRNNLVDNFTNELSIIGGNIQDITLGSIIDLMIYQSTNVKSQVRIEGDLLWVGERSFTNEDIDSGKDYIINFLVNNKRHQIKIGPKSETDNTKTNLQSNSVDYLKYLVNNRILNTNAVVNEPTFQGYTNIYLNPSVSLQNNTKPINNIKERLSKVRSLSSLTEAYNSITPEQQGLYKQFFTDRKTEINNGINVENIKISEQGVAIDSTNLNSLDFNPETNEPILEDSGAEFVNEDELLKNNKEFNEEMLSIKMYNDGDYTSKNFKVRSPEGQSFMELKNRIREFYLEKIRNSENNFVSLSEIPGTVENTEKIEVQDEVYEIPTNPRDRQQDINRLVALNKRIESGKELRPNELSDYNKFKNAYPQEFEKRCK